jgi:hypothetical protein
LFYRGRTFDGGTGELTVDPVADRFRIWIETDKERLAADLRRRIDELPKDQFTNRPFAVDGFAYPSCSHPILVSVLYKADDKNKAEDKKSLEVDVELRSDEGNQKQSLTLVPGEKSVIASRTIAFGAAKNRDSKAPSATGKYLRQRKLVVTVWPRGHRDGDEPLAQQAIELSEVNPEGFNSIDTWLSEPLGDQSSGTVNVEVSRHADDPVVCQVGINVQPQEKVTFATMFASKRRSRRNTHLGVDEKKRVGLAGGEACTFQFSLPKAEAQGKTYHFDVVFAGDYTMHTEFTVAGSAKSPASAASERTAPQQ